MSLLNTVDSVAVSAYLQPSQSEVVDRWIEYQDTVRSITPPNLTPILSARGRRNRVNRIRGYEPVTMTLTLDTYQEELVASADRMLGPNQTELPQFMLSGILLDTRGVASKRVVVRTSGVFTIEQEAINQGADEQPGLVVTQYVQVFGRWKFADLDENDTLLGDLLGKTTVESAHGGATEGSDPPVAANADVALAETWYDASAGTHWSGGKSITHKLYDGLGLPGVLASSLG